jgi:hypothetical protein
VILVRCACGNGTVAPSQARTLHLSTSGPGGLLESRPELHTDLVMAKRRCSWNPFGNKAVIRSWRTPLRTPSLLGNQFCISRLREQRRIHSHFRAQFRSVLSRTLQDLLRPSAGGGHRLTSSRRLSVTTSKCVRMRFSASPISARRRCSASLIPLRSVSSVVFRSSLVASVGKTCSIPADATLEVFRSLLQLLRRHRRPPSSSW